MLVSGPLGYIKLFLSLRGKNDQIMMVDKRYYYVQPRKCHTHAKINKKVRAIKPINEHVWKYGYLFCQAMKND